MHSLSLHSLPPLSPTPNRTERTLTPTNPRAKAISLLRSTVASASPLTSRTKPRRRRRSRVMMITMPPLKPSTPKADSPANPSVKFGDDVDQHKKTIERSNMAEAVVSITLHTLGNLVTDKVRFLSGVTTQVEEISKELKRMKLFLKDADSRILEDEIVRNWLREIRLLAYKVEDILETFAVEVASNRYRRRGIEKIVKGFACMICEAKSLHKIGLEIAKAKRDLSNVTTSLQRYGLKTIGAGESTRARAGNENQWWGRQTYAHQFEEHFVGMEEDLKKLVSLVVDADKGHRVISIWGMGGLGKTTLVRRVYKHKDVQICFGRFAWACVTQHGQIRRILQDILMQLVPQNQAQVEGMRDREMVQQLHRVLKETKCLVVLDDIWKAGDWKSLVAAFPMVEGESKILLTTRDRKVAEIGFPFAPKLLTEKESWKLLQRIAFSRQNVEDYSIGRKLEDLGIEMARKCGGLPLAVSVLGGILTDKNSLTEWEKVNKYVSSYLSKVEDDPDGGVVGRVLSLSYYDLPYHLRPCFLYLASFKEGEMIDVEQLYHLWMAEGMVLSKHQRSDETLAEVAERYLDELVHRSMVQMRLLEFQISRKYETCSLHDMMRDLCIEKGREEEFIEVVDFQNGRQPLLEPSLPNNLPCRLAFHMDDEVVKGAAKASTSSLQDNQQLRSLLCVSKLKTKEISWPNGMLNLEDTKSLRALVFEGFDFQKKKLPVDIRKMIHLRYLKLNNCIWDELPSSIAELPFLQTLYIQVNNGIKVPNVVYKMKQLKHLYIRSIGRYTENGKLRLYGLTKLETLHGLNTATDEISDLSNLFNLRVLAAKIYDKDSLHVLIDHINKNGQKLKEASLSITGFDHLSSEEDSFLLRKVLMCGNLCRLILSAEIAKFPNYEPQMLQNLVSLCLENNKIEDDPMKTLEKLPQLHTLILGPDAYIGKDMACHEYGFPKLRDLYLLGLPNLESWCIEKEAMPKMSSLMNLGCQKLKMIPDGLRFVRRLERFTLSGMPGKFYDRIQDSNGRKGDDYCKIQQVASIFMDREQDAATRIMRKSRKFLTRHYINYKTEPIKDFLGPSDLVDEVRRSKSKCFEYSEMQKPNNAMT